MAHDRQQEGQPPPIPWRRIVVTAVVLLAVLTLVTVVILGPSDLNKSDALRLDAFKLVLAGIAGYGAIVTVWLALRRQEHHERHAHTQRELDIRRQASDEFASQALRAMELYSAATDQLASDQPAVRLAGVYSFDHLGGEYATYRQTIVDVFCSYLRMERDFALESASRAEGEVRATIQALLVKHARPTHAAEHYWPSIDYDLSNTKLRDFDCSRAHFESVTFEGAQFEGKTTFSRTTFVCNANFLQSRFDGLTNFRKTHFDGGANFQEVNFSGPEVAFVTAWFRGNSTVFRSAQFFTRLTIFRGTKFVSTATTSFTKASFFYTPTYERAVFGSKTTTFVRVAWPEEVAPSFVGAKISANRLLVSDAQPWQSKTLAHAQLSPETQIRVPD